MVGDTWRVRWGDYLSTTYGYGTTLYQLPDKSIHFENVLMPPGEVIHSWSSRVNFQGDRAEPMLPLIDGESPYEITLKLGEGTKEDSVMLRVVFIDRYDAEVSNIIIRRRAYIFKPPIQTYSYRIELINGGSGIFEFDSLVIREVSKEEFNEFGQKLEKNKKVAKKSKLRRGEGK